MKLARPHRSLLAWTLYACVLFNAFACSIAHAQMVGLQLSGLDAMLCSVEGNSSADSSESTQGSLTSSFSCPLCSTVTLALGLLLGLSWLLHRGREGFLPPRPQHRPPPRYSWPSANPRASPVLSC